MGALFGFIIVIIGILNIVFPEAMWMLSDGWKFKDSEPSDAALIMHRFGGIVGIIVGLVVMFS
ncbi:DUF6199 family natural product biosynthesis protein [Maledivibacter halophilus]|uniref:DUF6199 domain-containing protein n=1 Tax=Maledivibacter halophilus TaxID=36842 RepID=A0A1T5JJI2_9FIRM|nr:DUF6199 family natural product biosynthesis protein [Maledivibacter halophilus]SKC51378.1 hypothetical protein SAMN02194393_01226 [Maledivibacter halophilus]